jgi:hypothetical protein
MVWAGDLSCKSAAEDGKVGKEESKVSSSAYLSEAISTHVGPVGGSLRVDGNSSDEGSESSDERFGCHYDYCRV